ncbi:hypothetical protein Cgig2_031863 [Carnegiea gigantea]|uniref:VQ domain-containing protein n=1 Tax=Carnegiea gigantea TaxID=171969 RepID=A0A9Q1QNC2_9CARY|nr:hypothetical protein Cgig2_031863 [Carnegiea gigantea]
MTKNQSSNPGRGGTLGGMHRDSRVISKVQPPKIRIIHLFPPKIHHADVDDFRDLVQRLTGKNGGKVKGKGKKESRVISKVQAPKIRVIHLLPAKIHHADVADFRDLVQRLTGKNGGKVKGKGKGKKVKHDQEDTTTIRCDYPTVIIPKVEAEMMGKPAGSSSSCDHHQDLDQHHHWRPSSSSSSSGDDHDNNMFSGGGYIPPLKVDDDGFDFTSLFNFDDHDHHNQSSSGDDDHNNDIVLSNGGYLSTFYEVDNDGFDLNPLLMMEEDNLNPFGDYKFN